jgi:hypothetical protein
MRSSYQSSSTYAVFFNILQARVDAIKVIYKAPLEQKPFTLPNLILITGMVLDIPHSSKKRMPVQKSKSKMLLYP